MVFVQIQVNFFLLYPILYNLLLSYLPAGTQIM